MSSLYEKGSLLRPRQDVAFGNVYLPNLVSTAVLGTDSSGKIIDGSGSAVVSIIAGTNINVSDVSGNVTISTVASPNFTDINLSSLTANLLVSTDASKNLISTSISAGTNINVADSSGNKTISTIASPTFTTVNTTNMNTVNANVSSLSAGSFVVTDASKNLISSNFSPPVGYIYGLNFTTYNPTTFTVTFGAIMAQGTLYPIVSFTNMDVTTVGAGGLDTGTFTENNWYYVYFIGNAAATVTSCIMSLSATTPSPLPAGYTNFRYIGSIKSDSQTATICDMRQDGKSNHRHYQYFNTDSNESNIILTGGNSTSITQVSYTGGAPPLAAPLTYITELDLQWAFLPVANTVHGFSVYMNTTSNEPAFNFKALSSSTDAYWGKFNTLVSTNSISYAVETSSDSLSLTVIGYHEDI